MAKNENSEVARIDSPFTVLPSAGEDFTGRMSLTVPDQSLSVREIVDKFTRGLIDFPQGDLVFLNDEEIPNFESMAKIDQLLYAADMRHLIAKRKDALEKLEAEGKKVKEKDYPNLTPLEPVDPPDNLEE